MFDPNNMLPLSTKLSGLRGITESLVRDGLRRTRPGKLGRCSCEPIDETLEIPPDLV